jgi:hypothetical protein
MSFVLIAESRPPTEEEMARHRVVLTIDDGKIAVVKNNLGGLNVRSGLSVTAFLHVAEAQGWEVDRV